MVDEKTVKECATIAMNEEGYTLSSEDDPYGSFDHQCGCGARIARKILQRFGIKMMVRD